jgi:hypothetical protein
MATDSSVAITAGSGTVIDTVALADGNQQQIVRIAPTNVAPAAPTSWTVTTLGLSNVIAADYARVAMFIVSNATGRVWIRFDATIPTLASHSWFLDPGDRWEVPSAFVTRAVSLAGQVAGGSVLITLGGTT